MINLNPLWLPQPTTSLLLASTALALSTLAAILTLKTRRPHPKVLPSPLQTLLPHLSPADLSALHYTPSAFPGARDVPTPYGSIRVYEFGPATGRKVALVHGISTSCQTLGPIATALAEHGCRVLLFDLFGRGFSDGVGDLPHDARLYVSQVLCALASSELAWAGEGGVDLVGYSMGGGIAVHFAASFPGMVRSLVLLAPAGLIRPERFGRWTRWVFQSGVVPEGLLAAVTRRRLRRPISSRATRRKGDTGLGQENGNGNGNANADEGISSLISDQPLSGAVDLAAAEVDDNKDGEGPTTPLNERVMEYVRWMLVHHAGFVPAFMACIRHAPLVDQHDTWKKLSERPKGSICVVLGQSDEMINPDDLAEDALPLIGGREAVSWSVVKGGHDFVMTNAEGTLERLYEFWGMKADG